VREALGLPEVDWRPIGGTANAWEWVRFAPPLQQTWRLTCERAGLAGEELPEIEDLPELLASGAVSGRVLPVPPGPFGGTTLLVLPRATEGEVLQSWLALEETDVMAAHGSFHQLRVAVVGGSPSFEEVLADLHRKNVLVVPTSFCADAAYMRELRDRGREHWGDMTVTFLPGLGGRLHLATLPPGE
jgi:hypothetical protein